MAATLDTVFGPENMKDLVTLLKPRGGTLVQDTFKSGMVSRQWGEVVDLDTLTFGRGLAPFQSVSAASLNRGLMSKGVKKTNWLEINVDKIIPMQKIEDQRYPGTVLPNVPAMIRDEAMDLRAQVDRSVEYVCSEVLFNASGAAINGTTVPGTESSDTLDWGLNELNATASWATTSTKILSSEIPLIRDDMQAGGDHEPGLAICSGAASGPFPYLVQNSEIGDRYLNQPAALDVLRQGAKGLTMLGLGGIGEWVGYSAGYVPDGGSFTRYISSDKILFLPAREALDMVLGFAEGYVSVPTATDGPVVGAGAIDPNPQTGIQIYAIRLFNPNAIQLVMVYRFLPIVRDPNGLCLFDPTP